MSPQEGDEKLSPMPQAEGDDKVKKTEKRILTLNKLLRQLPALLPPLKAGNNKFKLKNETRKIFIYFINTMKLRKHFTTI